MAAHKRSPNLPFTYVSIAPVSGTLTLRIFIFDVDYVASEGIFV